MHVTKPMLEELLGPPRYVSDTAERKPEVGVITGLAWTPVGGDIMFIECADLPGQGRGPPDRSDGRRDEGERAGRGVVDARERDPARHRSREDRELATSTSTCRRAAIKKDGPSAGVALTCAVVVGVHQAPPIRNDVAITGEIDLRGHALPVGGIKEKMLAAHRAGIKIVFMPGAQREGHRSTSRTRSKRSSTSGTMKKIDDALAVALGAAPPPTEPEPAIPPPTAPTPRLDGRAPAELTSS